MFLMDRGNRFLTKLVEGRNKMSMKSLILAVVTCLLCLSLSAVSFAQEITGNIVGNVKDVNGAGIPNATVTVTDPSKANLVVRTVTTSDTGVFSIPNIQVSTY